MVQSTHVPPTPTMEGDFEDLLRSLSRTCAFPAQVDAVDVRQTHISAVFLGGELAFKLKKPVKLPFLDFSSLQRRHFFCEEELRLNRPWASGVYQGIVPVTQDKDGFRFQGTGLVVDWAVKMRRLSDAHTLRSRLNAGTLTHGELIRVAQRVAEIHQSACRYQYDQSTEAEADFRRRLHENWGFARGLHAELIDQGVLKRLEESSHDWLQRFDETLRKRANNGEIREVHGDLRLEHVYLYPDQAPPHDILILDCIEFCSGLRRIDIVADIAFLVMELQFAGHHELARCFSDVYFSVTEDLTGRELLPLFAAYRSAVRAKVAAIVSTEPEVSPEGRDQAKARSQAHWIWCLSELEPPDQRPALILVSGLPGTGKTTLARGLAGIASIDEVLRSDVVRKDLMTAASVPLGNVYVSENTNRVYQECLSRTRQRLLRGERVIVDATFQQESHRQSFLQLAIGCGVRCLWLECTAPKKAVRQRLDAREGDASDADGTVYQLIQQQWEPASEFTERFHAMIDASGSPSATLNAAQDVLRVHCLTT